MGNLGMFVLHIAIVVASCLAVIAIALVLFFHFRKRTRKEVKPQAEEDTYSFINKSVGGKDNIISATARLTRLTIQLRDVHLVDIKGFEERGIKIILMEQKITVLLGEIASSIATRLEESDK